MVKDRIRLKSRVVFELRGPDGKLKDRRVIHNLVTDNGDAYIASRMRTTTTVMTAIMLGRTSTAAAKSGAGSFISTTDYVTGSKLACDNGSPAVGGTARVTHYERTWAAGVGTEAAIQRAAVVDNTTDAGEADGTHTLAIAVLPNAPINKTATDTLKVTWDVTITGA